MTVLTPPINVKVFGERNSGTNYVEGLLRRQPEFQLLDGSISRYIAPLRKLIKTRLLGVAGDQHLDPDRIAAHGYFANWLLRHRHLPQDVLWSIYYGLTERQTFGWKHRRVDRERLVKIGRFHSTRFICIVRNPLAWLVSMRRRPYGMRLVPGCDWETFLGHNWCSRSYDTSPPVRYKSLMDLWNRKVRSSVEFCHAFDNAMLLRYEDLLEDHQAATERIAQFLGTSQHDDADRQHETGRWSPITHSTKEGDIKGFADYQCDYRNERWMAQIPGEALPRIRASLDQRLCLMLGYTQSATTPECSELALSCQ